MKRTLRFVLVAAMLMSVILVAFAGCKPTEEPEVAKTLTIDKTSIAFDAIGASETIVAKLDGVPALDGITWASSDPAVATVSNGVVISGQKDGTTNITAKYGAGEDLQTKTCVVTSSWEFKLTLDKTAVTLSTTGTKTHTIVASVKFPNHNTPTPGDFDGFTYSSANEGVATVSDKGVITAVAQGLTSITVTTKAESIVEIPRANQDSDYEYGTLSAIIKVGVDLDMDAMAELAGVYVAEYDWEAAFTSGKYMYVLESAEYTGSGADALADMNAEIEFAINWKVVTGSTKAKVDTVTDQIVYQDGAEGVQYVFDSKSLESAPKWYKVTSVRRTVTATQVSTLTLNADGTFTFLADQAKRANYATNKAPFNRSGVGEITVAAYNALSAPEKLLYTANSDVTAYYLLTPNTSPSKFGVTGGSWVAYKEGSELIVEISRAPDEFVKLHFSADKTYITGESYVPYSNVEVSMPAMALMPLPEGVNYIKQVPAAE